MSYIVELVTSIPWWVYALWYAFGIWGVGAMMAGWADEPSTHESATPGWMFFLGVSVAGPMAFLLSVWNNDLAAGFTLPGRPIKRRIVRSREQRRRLDEEWSTYFKSKDIDPSSLAAMRARRTYVYPPPS